MLWYLRDVVMSYLRGVFMLYKGCGYVMGI